MRSFIRRTIAGLAAGALLIIPTAGMAHAGELPTEPNYAYAKGHDKNQPKGNAYGRVTTDTTAPGIAIVAQPTSLNVGELHAAIVDIADNSGSVARAVAQVHSDAWDRTYDLGYGRWSFNLATDGVPVGTELTFKVTATDAAGNTSTIDGQPIQVVDTTAPAIAIVSVDPTEVSASARTIAQITVDAADNSGQLSRLYVYVPSGLASSSNLTLGDDGHYHGYVQVNDGTSLGPLAWQVIGTDAAGNTSTVDGQPLNVIA